MNVPRDQLSVDGIKSDGVGHYAATPEQLAKFDEASEALSRFRAPTLVHANNPHEKLFVAAFDGTGNDKFNDPAHATNVAKINDQIEAAYKAGSKQVYAKYIPGPGTQENALVRTADLAMGFTYEDRLEEMYDDLVRQAVKWRDADPDVQIRVQNIGFSRGASQAAGFTRLVHERGIRDPDSKVERVNERGELVREYTRHFVEPGKTIQTIGLFDPVATGVPMTFDRRLPPSVVSGFQITAADELRAAFPSDQILPLGLSEDGRFLNVMVPGAHSDVGGSYHRDGLSIRCGNLMTDYCNSARDEPFLQKRFEPNDPRLNVIHRSNEGMAIYQFDPRESVRGEPSGTNTQLAPEHVADAGPLPHHAKPVNAELTRALPYPAVRIAPLPAVADVLPPPMLDTHAIAEAGRSAPLAPKVLGAVGVVATAYDAVTTGERAVDLHHQGNRIGSQSEILHFGGRNAGMLGGAAVGAEAGAALGIESGPGALLTGAVGCVIGAIGGEQLANAIDNYRIYNQSDKDGNRWHYDAKQPARGWTRTITTHEIDPHGIPNLETGMPAYKTQTLTAPPALANELNYKASGVAVQMALAYAPTPQDPYSLPAGPGDTPSLRDSHWTRNTQTHAWSRTVTTGVMEHGMVNAHTEIATPQKTAELTHASDAVVARNIANSPHAIAQRYQATYAQYGWNQFGAPEAAVTAALRAPDNMLQASDGHDYTRGNDGQWAMPGMLYGTNPATGNTRDELAATYQREHSAQVPARATVAQSRSNAPRAEPASAEDAGITRMRERQHAREAPLQGTSAQDKQTQGKQAQNKQAANGMAPTSQEHSRKKPTLQENPSAFLDYILAAAKSGDRDAFRQATLEAANGEPARAMRASAVVNVDRQVLVASHQQQLDAFQQQMSQQQAQQQAHARSSPAR